MKHTITLAELYGDSMPDEEESLWNYVGLRDYKQQAFRIIVVDPVVLANSSVNIPMMDPSNLDADGRRHIRYLRKHANDIAAGSMIVVADDEIVDGFHRVYALAKEGIHQIRAVDLNRPAGNATHDRHNPSEMREARVLYRSVSLPEFVHIFEVGKIVGGANTFNPWDPRKYAFFADAIDETLIHQGEELERQAEYALRNDPIHAEFKELKRISEDERVPHRERLKAHTKRRKLQERYIKKANALIGRIRKKLEKLPISSVVLVTKPVSGGTRFHRETGESGHSGDEYGFPSSAITTNDIDHVLLIKNGGTLGPVSVDEARGIAKALASKLW